MSSDNRGKPLWKIPITKLIGIYRRYRIGDLSFIAGVTLAILMIVAASACSLEGTTDCGPLYEVIDNLLRN